MKRPAQKWSCRKVVDPFSTTFNRTKQTHRRFKNSNHRDFHRGSTYRFKTRESVVGLLVQFLLHHHQLALVVGSGNFEVLARFIQKSLVANKTSLIVIITKLHFYPPSCLGQDAAKIRSSICPPVYHSHLLPHTVEASYCPFNSWTSSRKAVNTNFYGLWFDPTGNRTRVYRFSSRRSIHLNTDHYDYDQLTNLEHSR